MELFEGLPRQGPGSDADTLSALAHTDLAERQNARVLDAGCGGGASTLALARAGEFDISAFDLNPLLVKKAQDSLAGAAGVRSRVEVTVGDMKRLTWGADTFDAVWCEGALYVVGFAAGLAAFAPLVRPGGWICATELSWVVDAPPLEAVEYWREQYPGMASTRENLARARAVGLECVAHFPLGNDAWWDAYYGPMQLRAAELRATYKSDAEALVFLDAIDREIDVYLHYGPHTYSYVFYVLRRPT